MRELIVLMACLLAGPAIADTLTIVPVDRTQPPVVNRFPTDAVTGAMFIPGLSPARCAELAQQLSGNPLAKGAQCAAGPVDLTMWPHG